MKFLNYSESVSYRLYLGYASISFRDDSPGFNSHRAFVLNSKNDGWFRRTEGISDGYGLCILKLKITSKKPIEMGHYKAYKCTIEYTDWNTEEPVKDFFWLYIHENFELEEIIDYIEENKTNWRP